MGPAGLLEVAFEAGLAVRFGVPGTEWLAWGLVSTPPHRERGSSGMGRTAPLRDMLRALDMEVPRAPDSDGPRTPDTDLPRAGEDGTVRLPREVRVASSPAFLGMLVVRPLLSWTAEPNRLLLVLALGGGRLTWEEEKEPGPSTVWASPAKGDSVIWSSSPNPASRALSSTLRKLGRGLKLEALLIAGSPLMLVPKRKREGLAA
jgi:hypothetical protein